MLHLECGRNIGSFWYFFYILARQQTQNDRQREKLDECMKGGRGIFQLGDSEKSTL